MGGLEFGGSVFCDPLGTVSWAVSILVHVYIIRVIIACYACFFVSIIVKEYIYI